MAISKSTGSKVNREWTHTGRPFSSFQQAKDEYEGFCPILPVRMTGISDFDSIRSATKNYINKHRNNYRVKKTLQEMGIEDPTTMSDEQIEEFTTKQTWTFMRPNTDRYRQNVVDIRNYFKQAVGTPDGYIQPMRGRVILEIEVVCPSAEDKAEAERRAGRSVHFPKYDVDNCFKPIQDALDFRADTNEGRDENGKWREGKKLGLVVDDRAIIEIRGRKRSRRDGEQTGFYWKLRRVAATPETSQSVENRRNADKYTDKYQQDTARLNADTKHEDRWENALSKGLTVAQRTRIRLSLLTNDETPLDPVIAEHYLALRHFYDRNTSASLVFEEQNQVSAKLAFGADAEPLLCEVEKDVDEYRNSVGIDIPAITEPTCIKVLDTMPLS